MTGIQGAHTIRFIELCAIVLGVVWLSVNLYMIYPLLRELVSSRSRGTPDHEQEHAREQSARRERAERPVPDGGSSESGSGSPGADVPTMDLLILAFVVVQMLLQAAGYRVATGATGWTATRRTAVCFLTLPCYWLLQWTADLRALRQIYLGDIGWEKTDHNGQHGLATDGGRIADHETW